MIIRELNQKEVQAALKEAGLANHIGALPYRGYAVTLSDNGKRRRFIGHHPDGRYLLQELPSDLRFDERTRDWQDIAQGYKEGASQ